MKKKVHCRRQIYIFFFCGCFCSLQSCTKILTLFFFFLRWYSTKTVRFHFHFFFFLFYLSEIYCFWACTSLIQYDKKFLCVCVCVCISAVKRHAIRCNTDKKIACYFFFWYFLCVCVSSLLTWYTLLGSHTYPLCMYVHRKILSCCYWVSMILKFNSTWEPPTDDDDTKN